MRILFVPFTHGVVSHGIPLVALASKLDHSIYKTAFLVPKEFHQTTRSMGLNVIDVDHHKDFGGLRTELLAYNKFKPDIVVDDFSISTVFASALSKIPRVTIYRAGIIPWGLTKNKYMHCLEEGIDLEFFKNADCLGLTPPQSLSDLFKAEIKIIPGIKEIDVLPESLINDPTYIYAGPLIMGDNFSKPKVGEAGEWNFDSPPPSPDSGLEEFFESNKDRLLVFFYYGTYPPAPQAVADTIRYLLERDTAAAVISTIPIGEVKKKFQQRFFYSSWLPMHFVCSRVHLYVHHMGAATCQYGIFHGVPSISVGTQRRDSEGMALQLEKLGVNRHLPSPDECDDFLDRFREVFQQCTDLSGPWYKSAKRNLKTLKEEAEKVMKMFDFDKVLKMAIEKFHNNMKNNK